jgi:3-dehydroquinate dehydratase / shikimate dehydrogenase
MLFLTIPALNREWIQKMIQKYENEVDGFEIRWDYAHYLEPEEVRNLTSRPLIYTLRTREQGGQKESISWDEIYQLAKARPNYLDLEYHFPSAWFQKLKECFPRIQLIVSFHDMKKVPNALPPMPQADIQKIACFCSSACEALQLLSLSKDLNKDFILLGMGEKAQFTRIMNRAIGSVMTFACLPDLEVAPGQLSIDEMNIIYRARTINSLTRFYGLLGQPVEHSIGHIFHNAYFEEHQQNARYVKIEVLVEELEYFLQKALYYPFDGLSITMPLKTKVLEYSLAQEQLRSVNTLLRKEQQWLGFNTDMPAIWQALKSYRPASVLILGAGAVGVSLYEVFLEKGIKVYLFNRSPKKGKTVLGFDETFPSAELIINTLPHLDEHIQIKLNHYLTKPMRAMDLVYLHDDFSKIVRAKKIPLITGQEIFYLQARLQQEIWKK